MGLNQPISGSGGGSGGAGTDELAKVSANDTTAGYLNGKLVAGANVTLTDTANHAGTYRLEADRDVLDPTWNLPVFDPETSATVEVTSA